MINGRAKHAAIYPDALCNAICKGIREQLDHDEIIARLPRKNNGWITNINDLDIHSIHNDEADASCFYDDVTGAKLDPKLVMAARAVEMQFFKNKGVYD